MGVETDKARSQEIHGRVQAGDSQVDQDQWRSVGSVAWELNIGETVVRRSVQQSEASGSADSLSPDEQADRGSDMRVTATARGARCLRHHVQHESACGLLRSINAVTESFFGTRKNELIYRRPWLDRDSARDAISEYIEIFYNQMRRHSTIGNVSPARFEESVLAKATMAA